MHIRNAILALAVLPVLASSTQAAPFRSYHIGNSLTNNLLDGGRFANLSTEPGRQHSAGYHLRGSAPLNYICENPQDNSGASPATLDVALCGYEWDAVTFQPYVKSFAPTPSTLDSDVRVINDLVALTRQHSQNGDTRFYIYAAWPAADLGTYAESWSRPVSGSSDQPTMLSRAYFDALYERVLESQPDVRMIPAGEALFHVDEAIRTGLIPGMTGVYDLYGDTYHLNDLGRHVIGAATYATLFAESPVGLPYSSTSYPVSPETLNALQETVWGVVTSHSYTSVPEPAAILGLVPGLLLLRRTRP